MINLLKSYKNNRGATILIIAITLPVLLGFAALAVDVGYMYATRNELQNAADAAALAGATQLGAIYLTMDYEDQQSYNVTNDDGNNNGTSDEDEIKTAAQNVSQENSAAGQDISMLLEDIEIGQWDFDTSTLTVTNNQPDAVRVVTRRDASANGPVSTFFANIFSIFGGSHEMFSATARAAAALSGPSVVDTGELNTPFGISENVFDDPDDDNVCGTIVEFSPTTSSCAGWHTFFEKNMNANSLDEMMLDMIAAYDEDEDGDGTLDGLQWLSDYFNIPDNKAPEPYEFEDPDGVQHDEVIIGDELTFGGGVTASEFEGGVLIWQVDGDNKYYDEDGNNVPQYTRWDGAYDGKDDNPAPIVALFDFYRMHDDDDNDNTWVTTVPIYEDGDDCTNPSGKTTIVGFARIEVIKPCTSNESTCDKSDIKVKVDCTPVVVEGLGGGGQYGNIKGSIPNLVE